jgi:Zn-dependent metalloprotease
MRCSFVPPYLLARVAPRLLDHDAALRARRTAAPSRGVAVRAGAAWTVHTAGGTEVLPGTRVRAAGGPASGDPAVDEAARGITGALALFAEVYGRRSFDGRGAPVSLTVHYGRDYDNAFWDGTQLVFGDGDGQVFGSFTKPIDVCGHEFTHAVTQYTANLTYSGQSGALNESVSDVFGSLVKQKALGQDAASADWLIGADIVGPALKPALRSMKDPGHANPYDDQPADMDGYVVGGDVHTNSGIPNHAFYVVATTYGGNAWEAPGHIWYQTLLDPQLSPNSTFAKFARVTLSQAAALYGPTSREYDAVYAGWEAVKVPVPPRPTGGATGPVAPQQRQQSGSPASAR